MTDKTMNLLPLLEKIAKENNFQTYDIKVKPISTGGANYSSQLYLATICGDGHHDLRLFVKIAAMGEKMRGQCNGDIYGNERFIYTKLMIAYKQLEDRHNVPEEHRLRMPRYYGADATYLQEVMVLEDLACQGFTLHNRTEPVDWKYAAAAVSQLAKYHALSFAFEHKNPNEFKEVLQRCADTFYRDTEDMKAFYHASVKTALASVREEYKYMLKSFLDRHKMTEFNNFYRTNRRAVILHGDFRPSNIMHRLNDDGAVELILLDYQILIYGSPVMDLLYFIFLSTDGSARAQYYDKLVSHYHSELDSALHRLGLRAQDVYPEEEYRMELKEKLPFGLLLSSLMLPALLVPEDEAPKMDSDMNITNFVISSTGDLPKKRLNEVVEDYITWGVLS